MVGPTDGIETVIRRSDPKKEPTNLIIFFSLYRLLTRGYEVSDRTRLSKIRSPEFFVY